MKRTQVAGSRPVFLNLAQIQLPVGALTSIAHRISGVILAFAIPAAVYALDLSLRSEQSYSSLVSLLAPRAVRVALVVIIWALAHHLLAGIRHLLSDIDIGSLLRPARRSAWTVNVAGVALALIAAGALF
ncbi:MAG: succinate dehydrogenase, cytochrome b556 subunit [Casimicrobiaceae bacterium]